MTISVSNWGYWKGAFGALALGPLVFGFGNSSVLAQQDADTAASEDDLIEEVIVIGSRIKRRDLSSPSPITTISSDDLEYSGTATVEELLNQLPQAVPGFGRVGNNPGNGTAQINLRGFGPGRTLVLLNGRRVAASGVGSAVDLNNLPQALISRIEMITGGASTVYGSDAVAGAVNFVTKKDFDGIAVDAHASITEKGDSEIYGANLAYGHEFADGRGNISAYFNYYERKPLLAAERESEAVPYDEDWDTGELFETGSYAIPEGLIAWPLAIIDGELSNVMFNADGTPRAFIDPDDVYNYAPDNYLQIPLTRYAGGIFADYELGSGFEGYLELSYARNEATQQLAPVPAGDWVTVNLDNPLLVPETAQLFSDFFMVAPNTAVFRMRRRMNELGPRIIVQERDYWRALAGLRGELGGGWDFDAWFTYSRNEELENLLNDGSRARMQQALLVDPGGACYDPTGGCVGADLFGPGRLSEEAAAFIRYEPLQNTTERTQLLASAVVTGSPLEIWAGPIDMAFGAEWRSDEARFKADDALFTFDTLGYRGDSPVEGTEKVYEFYSEAVVPLASDQPWARELSLELGGRYSVYDHAGGVWTYKAGGEWQPFVGLRLRAMYQRSVRAPNNLELFQEQYSEFYSWVGNNSSNDPCSASNDPVGNGNAEKCVIQGLDVGQVDIFEATPFYPTEFIRGGNADLRPEKANTWTIGAVITPTQLPGLNLTIDYYNMKLRGSIGEINIAQVCFDPANAGNTFCDQITRDASGNVSRVVASTENKAFQKTRGVDTAISYKTDLPDGLALFDNYAQLGIDFLWTHMISNITQQNIAATPQECAGRYGYFGWICGTTLPRDKTRATLHYSSGPFQSHLTWRYIGRTETTAYETAELFFAPVPNLAVTHIEPEHYLDLSFGYDISENINARIGISNLTDNKPQLAPGAVWSNNNDLRLYDIFGRSFFASLSARF